eukprot:729188-Rhodomonas_salina.5
MESEEALRSASRSTASVSMFLPTSPISTPSVWTRSFHGPCLSFLSLITPEDLANYDKHTENTCLRDFQCRFGAKGPLPLHSFSCQSNDWTLERGDNDESKVTFVLKDTEVTKVQALGTQLSALDAIAPFEHVTRKSAWPHPFELSYEISFDPAGELLTKMTVRNVGKTDFEFTCALHTYFCTSLLLVCACPPRDVRPLVNLAAILILFPMCLRPMLVVECCRCGARDSKSQACGDMKEMRIEGLKVSPPSAAHGCRTKLPGTDRRLSMRPGRGV